jgi:4-amino-4-deoxy-L-arabinose transferase-like glycosyltransferase
MTERTKRAVLLSVLAVSLIIRLGAMARIGNPQHVPRTLAESDAPTYYRLAENLAAGVGYRYSPGEPPTARRTPGYPFFLASVFKLRGVDFTAVRAVQCLLDMISTFFVFAICMFLFGNYAAAILAALAYALYPPAVMDATYILSETLYTFLLLAFVVACLQAMKARRYALFAASGIFFGLATLTRPGALPLPFVLIIIALIWKRSLFMGFVILAVAFSLTMLPWGLSPRVLS